MCNYLSSYKKLLISLLTIFIAFFFVSCSSNNEKISLKNQEPSWYLNPISNDSVYLYGVAEGENIDIATKNALISISSNLMLSINSDSTLKKESITKYREYVSKEYTQNIESKTENLSFQNYELIETYKQKYNKYFVNVRVKKSDLVSSLKNEYKLLNNEYNIALKTNIDKLSKYLKYESLYFRFRDFVNKIQILSSLDKNFSDKIFYEKMFTLKSEQEKLKEEISFVIYKKSSDHFLVTKVKKAISNFGFSIKNDGMYEIHLNSNFNFKNARGMFIANNELNIDVVYEDKIIISDKYNLTGYSSNNIDDAIFNSYEEFILEIF